MGIPTSNGLGARAANAYTLDEWIKVNSLAERGRLTAGLLAILKWGFKSSFHGPRCRVVTQYELLRNASAHLRRRAAAGELPQVAAATRTEIEKMRHLRASPVFLAQKRWSMRQPTQIGSLFCGCFRQQPITKRNEGGMGRSLGRPHEIISFATLHRQVEGTNEFAARQLLLDQEYRQ